MFNVDLPPPSYPTWATNFRPRTPDVIEFPSDVDEADIAEVRARFEAWTADQTKPLILTKGARFVPAGYFEAQAMLSEPIKAEPPTPWLIVASVINSIAIALLGIAVVLIQAHG